MSNMKDFIKTIKPDINDSIETAGKTFLRIFRWLEDLTPEKTLSASDVQTVLHSSAILHIYYQMFGAQLQSQIFARSIINACEHLRTSFNAFEVESPLVFYATKILLTRNCVEHIQAVEYYILAFLTEKEFSVTLENVRKQIGIINQPSHLIWDSVKTKDNSQSKKKTETICLVNRAFQFRNEDIEIAINRIINHLSFDYIAWIIMETDQNSPTYEKCAIIQYEICKQLNNFSISAGFLKSMYDISSADSESLQILYKCLGNESFGKSLVNFFLEYLSNFKDPSDLIQPVQKSFIGVDFSEMIFLIAAALSLRSPIRVEFYNTINCTDYILGNLIDLINHQKFIYDF